MQRRFALALTAAIVSQFVGPAAGARAQQSSLPCEAFQKNADGSWTVLSTTFIEGPQVKVQEGAVLPPGYTVLGYDIPDIIAKACPNALVGAPPAAAAPAATAAPATAIPGAPAAIQQSQRPQAPLPPQMSLSRYADANGSIDVERLTCGQLDDTSGEDASLFLAWYSGWYSALAKKHAAGTINIARLRYAMHNVIDYCRTNRDKKLTQVMELMLK
jgi:HdeA/HdeB family